MEFISCISYTTSIFHQVQMLEIEAAVAREQKDIHRNLSQEITALEKQLNLKLTQIRTEINDTNLPILREDAKQVLNQIHQSEHNIHS